MAKILYNLGKWSAINKTKVLLLWVILLVGTIAIAIGLKPVFSEDMSIPDTPSEKALEVIKAEFPHGPDNGKIRVIFGTEDGEKVTSNLNKKNILTTINKIKEDESVKVTTNPFEVGTISENEKVAYADITYSQGGEDISNASYKHLEESISSSKEAGIQTELTGDVKGSEMQIGGGSEVVGIALAFVVLAITFASFLVAGLPILTALLGLGVSVGLTMAAAKVFDIASVSLSLAGMIGIAVGIDYALFIFSKHRQFMREGNSKIESIARATGTAGSAVVFAGLTVIVALCGLTIVKIPFMSAMGLTAGLSVLMAVLVSITLVPSVLSMVGNRMVPKKNKMKYQTKQKVESNFWGRMVTKYPIKLSLVGTLLLIFISIPSLHMELGLPNDGMKGKDTPERRSYDLLAEGFGEGFNGQLTVVADASNVDDKGTALEDAVKEIGQLENVSSVSPAMPNEEGEYAIITVTPKTGPNEAATKNLVNDVRGLSDNHVKFLVTGSTAVNIDVSNRLNDAIPIFAVLIVGFAFVLLTIVFRSLLVPIVAVLGFLLTMFSTLGLSVFILQDGNMIDLLSIPQEGPMLAFLPILSIGILFGLAMDYQVFLVSRMREEYVLTKNPVQAIQAGLKHSGPVVTAAGLIMIFVFAGFIFSGEETIKSMGLAMTFGVIFDAFIVRMTIVPSVMKLLGHKAWYLPKWLNKGMPNVDIEGQGLMKQKKSEVLNEFIVK